VRFAQMVNGEWLMVNALRADALMCG